MLMKIAQYKKTQFAEGSGPKLATIRGWINDGIVPGVVIGKQYYVELDVVKPVNHLVSKILSS